MKAQAEAEKELRKQHAKEIVQVRSQTIQSIANMITVHGLLESGVALPEDIEEGVRHFSECLNKL